MAILAAVFSRSSRAGRREEEQQKPEMVSPRLLLRPLFPFLGAGQHLQGHNTVAGPSPAGPWTVTVAHTYVPGTALEALHILTHLNLR